KISAVASVMKKFESGDLTSVDIKKDIAELHDISVSFNQLVQKLEQTTGELGKRALQLLTIKELSEIARKSLHMDDFLELLLDKAMTVTGTKIGSVFMVDEANKRFRVIASRGSESDVKKDQFINMDDSISKWVVDEKKPLLIEDIEKDPRTLKSNDPRYGPPSFLCMPIFAGDTISAVLNLAHKESGQLFDSYDEQALSIMLGEVSFALENAMLHFKVEEQLFEIKERNVTLEREIADRLGTEGKLASLNRELEEANRQLGIAYTRMKDSRDELRENLFREETGFLLNSEGLIEGVTERMLEYIGTSRDKLIGMPMTDVLHENCRDVFISEMKQAWMGITRQINVELISENDNHKSFELKFTRLSLDDRRLLLTILR
ncbi:MAG: GAF domain-containing protein, partial [Deltaproteobacteria bacterium]|nr:GAF domain-containing protein [Deltaproteobacteria bacterium]